MNTESFKEFEKKHTVVSKKFKGGIIAACALLGAGAITTGTLYGISIMNRKQSGDEKKDEVEINPIFEEVLDIKKTKTSTGDIELNLNSKIEHTRVSSVVVTAGTVKLTEDKDYAFDFDLSKVVIFKSALDTYKDANISVIPIISQAKVVFNRMPDQINLYKETSTRTQLDERVSKDLFSIYEDYDGNLIDVTDKCTFEPELGSDLSSSSEWVIDQKIKYLSETYIVPIKREQKYIVEPKLINEWTSAEEWKMIEFPLGSGVRNNNVVNQNTIIKSPKQITVVGTIDGKEYYPESVKYTENGSNTGYILCELTLAQKGNPSERFELEISGGALFGGYKDIASSPKELYTKILASTSKRNPTTGKYDSLNNCKMYAYGPTDKPGTGSKNYNFGIQEENGTNIFDVNFDHYGRMTQLKTQKDIHFSLDKAGAEYQPFKEKEINLKFYYNDFKPVIFEEDNYSVEVGENAKIAKFKFNYESKAQTFRDVEIKVGDPKKLRAIQISETEVCLIGLQAGETYVTISLPGASTGYSSAVKITA